MATIAKPSRAIPSRALIERARPSRAERERPTSLFYLDADLIDRVTHQSMDVSLLSENGKYVADSTGKWRGPFGADMPRLNGSSLTLAGEQYNTISCVKYDPDEADISAFSLGNSPAFDVEDMTDSLDGTDFEIFKGNAYHLSTKATGVWGNAKPNGPIGVTTESTIALVLLAPDGALISTTDGAVSQSISASNSWQLVLIEGFTPNATYAKLSIGVNPNSECWFILPHLLRQKRFESMILGNNTAAPATFATEAGSADNGISYDLDKNPALKATLGGLVYRTDADGQIIVETKTGAPVIDASRVLPAGTVAWGGTAIAGLTTGKLTFIEARVVGLAAGETLSIRGGNNSGMQKTISDNGPHAFTVQADADTNLKIFAPQGLTSDVTIDVVAKPVEAEGRIHWEGTMGFDRTDVDTSINLLSSDGDIWSLLYLSPAGYLRSMSGAVAATLSYDYSAGDFLSIDIFYSYITGKFHIECNGQVGSEYDFTGWNLSLDKIVEIWGFPDGMSLNVGPKRTYIEGVA